MPLLPTLLLLAGTVTGTTPVRASDTDPVGALLVAARNAMLADEPAWHELIHAEPARLGNGFSPAVRGDDFYLSGRKPLSPAAELEATLEAFAADAEAAPADPDLDSRCRFPGRRLWLSSRLGTAGAAHAAHAALAAPTCPALEAWVDLDAVRSLTLLHVSGFFGNPASAFGHLLMRVDTGDDDGVRGLTDLGVNFGARVPPRDGPLVYLAKGLFGGYDAGFVQDGFHVHDAVYSATEQRDMWAYELGLSRDERDLVLSHLWELTRVRFDYYFFKYNCAWNLSALLELVLDERLRPDLQPWHLPQSVFERLEAIDATTRPGLIRSVRFVPSLGREVVTRFRALTPDDARRANRLIEFGVEDAALGDVPVPVLDFLLDWTDYRAAGADARDADEVATWRARKRRVLSARLARPAGAPAPVPPGLPRPAAGPSARTLRLGTESVGDDVRLVLGGATYAYDALGANRGGLTDAGFRLLDLSLVVDGEGIDFRGIDLVAVEALAPPSGVAGESRSAWRLSLGLVGDDPTCVNCSDAVVEGGIGRSARLPERVPGSGIAYAFLDASLGTDRSLAGPALGLVYRPVPRAALRLESRWLAATDGDEVPAHAFELAWLLGRQGSLQLEATRVDGLDAVRAGGSLRW